MKMHRFVFILFTVGLLVFCSSYFFMQKRFDKITIAGAFIYLLGMVVSFIGYQIAKNQKERG
jgi:drug/metabolite transporter (DMT)-like permease